MKKCHICGRQYSSALDGCTFCRNKGQKDVKRKSGAAEFLRREVAFGSFILSYVNIYLLISINICIVSFVVNGIMYFNGESTFIWSPYVFSVLTVVFVFLKGLMRYDFSLMYFHRLFHIVALTFFIKDIFFENRIILSGYIVPVLAVFFSMLGIYAFATKRISTFSFALANIFNIVYCTVPLIMMRFFDFYKAQVIIAYVGFGIVLLIFVNYLLAQIVSLITKLRKGF